MNRHNNIKYAILKFRGLQTILDRLDNGLFILCRPNGNDLCTITDGTSSPDFSGVADMVPDFPPDKIVTICGSDLLNVDITSIRSLMNDPVFQDDAVMGGQ